MLNFKEYLRLTGQSVNLMAHAVLGYPDYSSSLDFVMTLASGGTGILELQIPIADPAADGPTIRKASEVAIAEGMNFGRAVELISEVTLKTSIPVVAMCYYNTLFFRGLDKALLELRKAGVAGVIVPDMPLDAETNDCFSKSVLDAELSNIRVVSPNITEERLRMNLDASTGLVYCVSSPGTTGGSFLADQKLHTILEKSREYSALPLAVGFGISSGADVLALEGKADIAVAGSSLLRAYNSGGLDALQSLLSELAVG